MIDNTKLLQNLFSGNRIALENAPILTHSPDALSEGWDFDRVEGMLLGLAIGASLGNTSESLLPQERRQSYGEIRDYLSNRHAGMRAAGLPFPGAGSIASWDGRARMTTGVFLN